METDKKVAKRVKRVKHTPILTDELNAVAPITTIKLPTVKLSPNTAIGDPSEIVFVMGENCIPSTSGDLKISGVQFTDAPLKPTEPETPPQPPQQNQEKPKPTFESDNSQVYRELLFERPVLPTITNIQEAVAFAGRYEQWNRKVQLAIK